MWKDSMEGFHSSIVEEEMLWKASSAKKPVTQA
jgi:hypothetical protein